MSIVHIDCYHTYQYQKQAVVEILYDMINWCQLCDNIILSTANTWPASTIGINWFMQIGSKVHHFQNVDLVQSGNSSIGEDKKDLHIPR